MLEGERAPWRDRCSRVLAGGLENVSTSCSQELLPESGGSERPGIRARMRVRCRQQRHHICVLFKYFSEDRCGLRWCSYPTLQPSPSRREARLLSGPRFPYCRQRALNVESFPAPTPRAVMADLSECAVITSGRLRYACLGSPLPLQGRSQLLAAGHHSALPLEQLCP